MYCGLSHCETLPDCDAGEVDRERVERRVDRAFERVLDRHDAALDHAAVDGFDHVVHGRERDALAVEALRGLLGEGALGAQEPDPHVSRRPARSGSRWPR